MFRSFTSNTSQATLPVTFEQQRHEGDVGRTEFGHSQSVGPVVPWGILTGAENKETTLCSFIKINRRTYEPSLNVSRTADLPSVSRMHSKLFLSCWGFSVTDDRAKRFMRHHQSCVSSHIKYHRERCSSHLPGLVKSVHCAVAQAEHHREERVEILLLL